MEITAAGDLLVVLTTGTTHVAKLAVHNQLRVFYRAGLVHFSAGVIEVYCRHCGRKHGPDPFAL